jgi:hypothetical protein
MRRGLLIGALVAATVLALAAPALAKGEATKITVTQKSSSTSGGGGSTSAGGSGAAPVILAGDYAAGWFQATGLGQTMSSAPVNHGLLGPAFAVTVIAECGSMRSVIHQTLYPYAAGGPEVFIAGGEKLCGEIALGPGWWATGSGLLNTLVSFGLPAADPTLPVLTDARGAGTSALDAATVQSDAAKTTQAQGHAARDAGTRSWIPTAVAVFAGGLLLLVGAAFVMQHRRSRVPA